MPVRIPSVRRGLCALSVLAMSAVPMAVAAEGVTDAERVWIDAAAPVLRAGRDAGLKVAIVVQPTPNTGQSAVASAFQGGECLLVLTLRGGVDPVAGTSAEQQAGDALARVLREAVVAHELAHCVRQAGGEWHRWPAGMTPADDAAPSAEATATADIPTRGTDVANAAAQAVRLAALRTEMAATRREEGYADLAALAWVARHHRGRYAQVHAWLWAQRDDGSPDGSHHDTRAWLVLARGPTVFDAAAGVTPWDHARAPWRAGLR